MPLHYYISEQLFLSGRLSLAMPRCTSLRHRSRASLSQFPDLCFYSSGVYTRKLGVTFNFTYLINLPDLRWQVYMSREYLQAFHSVFPINDSSCSAPRTGNNYLRAPAESVHHLRVQHNSSHSVQQFPDILHLSLFFPCLC